MSFLEELEKDSNENNQQNESEKKPRDLWESCFKYFRHFHSILLKNKQSFDSQFLLTTISKEIPCQITEPFAIKRQTDHGNIYLEIKYNTRLKKAISIKRKDERSAIYLKSKFAKDGILSEIKINDEKEYSILLKENIPSSFKLILENGLHFFIEYNNIHSSAKRRLRLPLEKVNQTTMDELAKYLLGKNPNLYKEEITEEERKLIQKNLNRAQQKKLKEEEKIRKRIAEEKRQEEIAKANTLKEKSKRYITKQSKTLGKNLLSKFSQLKDKVKKDKEI